MSKPEQLITEHIDIWTNSILAKSTAGRGSSKKYELYGIKKLRELILELAVRGKLVAQDPNDEPASVLLKKIEIIKQGLIKDKKIKRPKNLADVSDNEYHFETPQGWHWTRLNDIGEWGAGATPSRSNSQYYGGGIPWFKSGELSKDYISESQETITELALKETSLRKNKSGDVLLAMYGATIGKASILEIASTTNQAVCACTPFSGISNTFLLMLLKAYRSRFINMGAGGAQPNISREKIIATVIALPPKEEQNRIVAKVDELMLLCDQLEQQTEASIDAHATLVEVLLATLTDSTDANDLAQNWARVSEYFDSLFTTEQSIEALKQTILQLAVMGKLVPQKTEDEPASVLIKKIVAEKVKLIGSKKIKQEKSLLPISDTEKTFELPLGWEWCRFGKITFNRDSERIPLSMDIRQNRQGCYNYYGASGVIDSIDDYIFDEPLLLIGEDGANLISRSTPIAFIARGRYWVNNHAHVIGGLSEIFLLYLCIYINAISLESYITGTAQPKMNQAKMNTILIALPPHNEQCRIIAKVDELMKICDQLKDQLQQSQVTQIQLTDALVEKALV